MIFKVTALEGSLALTAKWKWPTAKFNDEWPFAFTNFLIVKLKDMKQAFIFLNFTVMSRY
jgi:hypothetical protein